MGCHAQLGYLLPHLRESNFTGRFVVCFLAAQLFNLVESHLQGIVVAQVLLSRLHHTST